MNGRPDDPRLVVTCDEQDKQILKEPAKNSNALSVKNYDPSNSVEK